MESHFNKVARLQHKCVSVKFLRLVFFTENLPGDSDIIIIILPTERVCLFHSSVR